jgi:hypothetical protein
MAISFVHYIGVWAIDVALKFQGMFQTQSAPDQRRPLDASSPLFGGILPPLAAFRPQTGAADYNPRTV